MDPHEKHRSHGLKGTGVVLVTVSTSRYRAKEKGERYADESGDIAAKEMVKLGHKVVGRELISDDQTMIRNEVMNFLSGDADVLIFMGGTGVARADVTIETVRPFFEKELDGFGELLRTVSFRKIGSAAALTRATAGVARGKLVMCLPGSPDAARVALRSFGKEIPHLLFVARS